MYKEKKFFSDFDLFLKFMAGSCIAVVIAAWVIVPLVVNAIDQQYSEIITDNDRSTAMENCQNWRC